MKVSPLTRIIIAISIAAIFLIRPYFLQNRGMWYKDDDYDYFAHSSAMVFGQYPSYQNEFFTIMKEGPQSPIGTGILAAPFVYIFSLLDRVEGSTIVDKRTPENIIGSWSQFGFEFASIFYFTWACYLIFLGISRFVAPRQASIAVILMMICQGLPLFVYRRPFFSHCSELFLQSVLMYLFLRKRDRSAKALTGVMVLCTLLYLTRPNDIAFALLWPFLLCDFSKGMVQALLQARVGLVLSLGIILFFKVWPEAVNHMHTYGWAGAYLSTPMSVLDIIKRILHILIGRDWGLVFTAPFLVISFFGIFLLDQSLLRKFRWLLLPIIVNFYVIIAWGSQGGWYGYRYFIVSAIPVMTLPLAYLLEWISKRINGWAIPAMLLLACPPVVSMIAFEGCRDFNLQILSVDFNRTDWTNPQLQDNFWSVLMHAPGIFCFYISQGFMALYYSIRGQWPGLSSLTWLRIIIILFIPWLIWGGIKICNLICIFRRKIIK